ncbi:uncharacterized protein LOC127708043 [Mytilus californianus]|uniref:uncharacterized protein LOC127708043 n=1 Tax=Mytilus californianus TaxID=6549 RepID=UPI002245ADA1|nr:uncharacterized protein LOC127708043 [Mytilus californianus]
MSEISDHELGYLTNEGVAVGISVAVIVVVCIIVVTVLFWRRNIRKKTATKVSDVTSNKTVDNSLGQQDIAPPQYPTDDKILYSQVSKGTQHYQSEDTQSPYSLSVEGVYDTTNERRHVINDTNVYSHAVDTVYDSSEQHTRQERKEEVYDHVFGQKLED